MAYGVFGLNRAYVLNRSKVFSVDDTHGWFGGGANPGPTASTVDRIDFSNDSSTASVRGPLSSGRFALAATGNSNYGWFGGGSFTLTVDRIDFSNDSARASVRGSLNAPFGLRGLTSTGNSNFGWFGGGNNGPMYSTVSRIDFSNDSSTASVRGPLSAARGYLGATGNSNYGWFGGGQISFPGGVIISTVDRIDFSNDSSTASVRGPLSSARYGLAATGNSNYGWFGGGANPVALSTVDRIDFSNDSATASVRGPLSSAREDLIATGNSNYGWFGGGGPFPGVLSTVDRIDFSNDSATASVRGSLSLARSNSSATSGQAKSSSIRPLKGGNFGWFGGGRTTGGPRLSTLSRINFSNDSVTALARGSVFDFITAWAATGNSNYGWFAGGALATIPATRSSAVRRIDFSNDSTVSSLRGGRLSSATGREELSATGNSNYGWFAGGRDSGSNWISTVDRIDFSNDSVTSLRRGPLDIAEGRQALAATGNSNYGWFAGGTGPATPLSRSTIFRIDFSNDSSTAPVRGRLTQQRDAPTATGNSNYGWFAGGNVPSPNLQFSIVERLDFSNDSSPVSIRGPLTAAKSNCMGTGNSNYGWFAGGFPGPSAISRVDRIDFSNDSIAASVRGLLDSARYSGASTSNTPVG